EQSSRATYHRGGHAGAAQSHVACRAVLRPAEGAGRVARVDGNRVCRRESVAGSHQGNNVIAGGHEVGLHEMVDARRTLRTVAGDRLGGLESRAVGIGSANGDDVRIVPRRADGGVTVAAERVVLTIVAGGNDHYDAGLPSGFHGLAQRILCVTLEYRTAKREIYNSNVVGTL